MNIGEDSRMTMTHWKGTHVMKDATVKIKMAMENLASLFCRKPLTLLLLLFTQIKMWEMSWVMKLLNWM